MTAQGSRSAHLTQLDLHRFRNLADGPIDLGPGLTLIVGRNGQGKTSLLEAAYLLGTTKSFRSAVTRELIRTGESEAVVAGRIEGARPERLAVKLRSRGVPKELLRGGQAVSAVGYLGAFHPVAFTGESRLLVTGAPELRRAFVDRGIAAARLGYLTEVAAFKRALRQKARLLETRARGSEVEAWNAELGRRAARVSRERWLWIESLKKKCRRWPSESSPPARRSR